MQLAAVSHLAFQDCDQKDLMSNDQMKQQLQYCKDIVGLVLRALSLAGSRDVEAPIFQPLPLPPPSLPLPPLPLPPLLPKFIIIFLANNMNKMH